MTVRSIMDECRKKSADPRFPGSGKDPRVGFAVGLLLGALGVGLYLRSLKDGLLSFAACYMVGTILDCWAVHPICWLLCGCWVTMRIKASNQRYAATQDADSSGSTGDAAPVKSPAPDQQPDCVAVPSV